MIDAKDLLEISIDNEIENRQHRIRQERALVSEELLHAARRGRKCASIYPDDFPWGDHLCEEVLQELEECGYAVNEYADMFGDTFYVIDWGNIDEK